MWRRVRPAIRKVKVIPTKAICVVARSEVERRIVVVSSSRRVLIVVVETCPTSSETTFQSVLADLPPAADCVYSNARCDILAPADWLVVLMIANERCFPYVYTPETGVPWYLRYSAEGQSYWSAARHALAYYLKSRRKKFSAPVEELEHFRNQRELMRGLVELDGGRSAALRPNTDRATLAAVGDLMWIRKGWTGFPSNEVLSYLNSFDVVLGNLESVISPRFKVPSFWRDYLRYNSEPGLVTSFARPTGGSTFSALSITNNHSMDYGEQALIDTMRFLDGQSIPYSGVREPHREKPYVTFEKNGIKFGFYATSWGLNALLHNAETRLAINVLKGLAPETDEPVDVTEIKRALDGMRAEGVDFRIVGIHWGREYEFYPTPRTMQAAREIVRAGADLILGSHPHVQQPNEVCFVNGYENRYGEEKGKYTAMNEPGGCILTDGQERQRKALVVYSLGNFVTAMSSSPCEIGMIQDIEVFRAPGAGAADWRLMRFPNYELVHNHRDRRTKTHKLVMMRDYLKESRERGVCSGKLIETLRFLDAHLGGLEQADK